MNEGALGTSVNEHYLNKVVGLAESMDVAASEDIFDARGNKLLAKGARVSKALQEKLIIHKLRKPLEACIVVEGGVNNDVVFSTAQKLVETNLPLAHLISNVGPGPSVLAVLSTLKFGSAMGLMLTIADKEKGKALEHAVTVSLLSIAIARRAHLSEVDQRVAGMAGLLHDVGELYIDPAFMAAGKRLLPHEWAHIVVHPFTGQMLIDALESFPPQVGRAIAEHHERFDGSGYPKRLSGTAISPAGQAVAAAEMIAGLLSKDRALSRAQLALKVMPGEHARNIVDAIAGALHDYRGETPETPPVISAAATEDVGRLDRRIGLALRYIVEMLAASVSARSRELLTATSNRIHTVRRSVVSTGLDFFISNDMSALAPDDPAILFEKDVATREIQWRLRDIARDVVLQASDDRERLALKPLIDVLDDDFSNVTYS